MQKKGFFSSFECIKFHVRQQSVIIFGKWFFFHLLCFTVFVLVAVVVICDKLSHNVKQNAALVTMFLLFWPLRLNLLAAAVTWSHFKYCKTA